MADSLCHAEISPCNRGTRCLVRFFSRAGQLFAHEYAGGRGSPRAIAEGGRARWWLETDDSLMTHVAGTGPVFLATSADQLSSPLRHASAMRQQLGHDPARCVHT